MRILINPDVVGVFLYSSIKAVVCERGLCGARGIKTRDLASRGIPFVVSREVDIRKQLLIQVKIKMLVNNTITN